MQYHHFKNYKIIIFIPIMAFKSEGKEMYAIFVFAVLLVNSLQSGKVWQACTQQTEKSHSHTNSAVSRQVYVTYMPC